MYVTYRRIVVQPRKQSSVETSLKQRVRQLLLKEGQELTTRLRIIDQLQSFGVAYHFEEEIARILISMHVHDAHLQLKHDLASTALLFRLLRAHGIPASTGKEKNLRYSYFFASHAHIVVA
jgi:hypothetical protein